MKRLLSAFLTVLIALSSIFSIVPSASAASHLQTERNYYTLANENDKMAFYLDTNTGDFALVDKVSNTTWYSNPVDWQHDEIAKGESYDELDTKLSIKYLTDTYETAYSGSQNASIIVERQGKDYVLTFYFKSIRTNFTIPIKLSLKDDYFSIEVLVDRIKELGDSRVVYVRPFQFFGAANLKDNGYYLLPDGSGSLMEFNKRTEKTFELGSNGEATFFAPNPTEVSNSTYFNNTNEPMRLPVFGEIKNGNGFIGIIESGASVCELHGYLSRHKNSYNVLYPSINIRDTQTRSNATGMGGNGSYYTDSLPENYICRYYFLSGDDADYVGMANVYRNYLIREKNLTSVKESASNVLALSLYGAIKKPKHFLGIPYTGLEDLTTYKETEAIIDRLKENGVDKVFLNYLGWDDRGMESTINTSFKPCSILGGSKDLNSLIGKANATEGVMLSMEEDLQAFYSSQKNVKKFKNTAYGLNQAPVTLFRSRISAGNAQDKSMILHQLIHPLFMNQYAKEFISNGVKRGVHSYSFNSIGQTLYCAYNLQNVCTRDQSEKAMENIFKEASDTIGNEGILSTGGGNAYAMPYVDNVIEAPLFGSRSIISSQEVPFYQIVFRGYVNLCSSAVNLNSEPEELILKLAETGSSPYYLLMDADSTSFQNTNFSGSYACNLDDHFDEMISTYSKLKTIYDEVGSSSIKDHRIISKTFKITTFSNGTKVYVNYGDTPVVADGISVDSNDFKVVGGDNA